MEKSLQRNLLEYIKTFYPNWVSIDEVYRICRSLNHKQSCAERKLRLLTHAGLIIPLKENGAIIAYRAIKTEPDLNKVFPPKKPEQERLFKPSQIFF